MKKIVLFLVTILFVSCTNTKSIVIVNHSNLPKPIGPYSHSTSFEDLIFVSGQIGIDPKTNTLKNGIEEQTVQIFENLKSVLENNNSDLDHIAKTTIFITDINQFETVNKIYGNYFQNHFPARSTIEVVSLPKKAEIEIECIAVKK
ncbi:Rid family detoxifying hydrolase [Flavobacterium aquicola]|uniref:2-iminobutanoate/2-iminopropanoate deaminase n=1 Tax=Flavobacterium aquicola TaxID=1682742 RepID=A0A3E0EQX3_9FLAO|nr:Rid family detoxifying hydrolase [Flavobacterium aquicola]REH00516.1 2-iminobutanoate/2-iminopropanoate deaminase [Flavobacterium aquicola]